MRVQFFGKIPFRDQVRLMSETDLLCGMHGAGFVNTLFLRPRSGFVAFFSPVAFIPYYQNLASKAGYIYKPMVRTRADLSKGVPRDKRNMNVFLQVNLTVDMVAAVAQKVWDQKYAIVNVQ